MSIDTPRPRRAVLAVVVTIAVALLAACGSSDSASLVDALPESGELGDGWERASDPRTGDEAEASTLCATGLDDGMVEGAKIDLIRDEDFASAYFRRYADVAAAESAFAMAADRISRCESAEDFAVLPVDAPDAGDDAFSALFSAPGTDPAFVGDFGWTLVRTDDVIRSLQFIPAPGAGGVEGNLAALTEGVADTD